MIELDHLQIGDHRRPFIIAEMSGNHNQSLDRALAITMLAAHVLGLARAWFVIRQLVRHQQLQLRHHKQLQPQLKLPVLPHL